MSAALVLAGTAGPAVGAPTEAPAEAVVENPADAVVANPTLADSPAAAGAATLTGSCGALAAEDLVWQEIVFGQSTDLNFSSNVLPEKVGLNRAIPESPGTIDGTIEIESRGGKLAPGHDGLTFYYVDLDPTECNFTLETDMVLEQLGPEIPGVSPNGQEGAGIMVRDLNGGARQDPMLPGFEEVTAASNFASVTWMRNGVNALVRTGVIYPWGNVGSQRPATVLGSSALAPAAGSETPVRLSLTRTDTSFVMKATYQTGSGEVSHSVDLEGADWVQDIDSDNMTLGFFAARNAKATFSNSSLTLSEANTQPRTPEPAPVVVATFDLLVPTTTAASDLAIRARGNLDGSVSLALNGEDLGERETSAYEVLVEPVTLQAGENTISATYTAPGHAPITRVATVTVLPFETRDLVAAPDGTPAGDGTVSSPLDIATAIANVPAGASVLLRGGTYTGASISVPAANSGIAGALKTIEPYEGEEVVLDGEDTGSVLLRLDGDYWHVKDLTITRANGNGMRMSGSHNVIENVVFAHNNETGLQITGGAIEELWPSHNLILNCVAHDNVDPAQFNADGFAAKLGVGPGNVFRGNVTHNNIDDGFDLYNRTNEGANHPIVLEGNIAYSNGKLSDGTGAGQGLGTGFKVGGEGLPVDHVLTGNLAFDNQLDGFSDNFNPGRLVVTNNTSVDNLRFNYLFRINPYVQPADQGVFTNNLSVRSEATLTGGLLDDAISGVVDGTNFFIDDATTQNDAGVAVSAEDFVSLAMPEGIERAGDGTILWSDYARPLASSVLATAGTDGGHVGAVAPQEPEVTTGDVTVALELDVVEPEAAEAAEAADASEAAELGVLTDDVTVSVLVELDGESAEPLVLSTTDGPGLLADLPVGTVVTLTALEPAAVEGARWSEPTWSVTGAAEEIAVDDARLTFVVAEGLSEVGLGLTLTVDADDAEPEPTPTPTPTPTPSSDGTEDSSTPPAPSPGESSSGPGGVIADTGASVTAFVVLAGILLAAGGTVAAAGRRARAGRAG